MMNLGGSVSASIVVLLAVLSFPLLNTFSHYWSVIRSSYPETPLESPLFADLIVKNGTIYTSDASLPFADAMAIRNGRIIRIGTHSSLQDLAQLGSKELDLAGKVVVPGFIDSHVHLLSGGLQMARVELRGVDHKDEFVRMVKEAAKDAKPGSWVFGGGWNNDLWGGELPVASWVDEHTSNNPVWLTRMDGHMGLANSVALSMAGINIFSKDPHGGTIMRTSDGEPSGLLVDSAMKLVLATIPEVSVEERRDALIRASKYALMKGVTTVIDVGRYFPGSTVEASWEDFNDVFQWADSSGKMMVRVCLFFPLETWSRFLNLTNWFGNALSKWIYLGGLKAFADGSLGSSSALLNEPYVDEPNNRGLQLMDTESLLNWTTAADKFGLQVAIHAIGDRANKLVLDVYESVASTNGPRDRRFRIEHAQHLAPEVVPEFGRQGIVASVQSGEPQWSSYSHNNYKVKPDHLLDDADSASKKLGKERAERESYLFRSLLQSNAKLAFGSDWPVADINPLGSIRTAMKRIPPGWKNAWIPSECLSLHEAINAYTISAAYSCFLDNELGSLSPGKLADFVILSADSWEDLESEGSASVIATYVAGVKAYP